MALAVRRPRSFFFGIGSSKLLGFADASLVPGAWAHWNQASKGPDPASRLHRRVWEQGLPGGALEELHKK